MIKHDMNSTIKTLHQQAQKYISDKQYQKAHEALIAILQNDKYFADAYFLLGVIASEHLNYSKAIQLFEQSLKLSTHNFEYLAQLAKHHALLSNDVEAELYAKKASDYRGTSAYVFDTIGVAYSKIGLHKKAVEFFKKATVLDNNNTSYFFNLGVSQTFNGDFNDAQLSHERVLEINPAFCKSYTALSSYGGVKSSIYNIEAMKLLFNVTADPDDKLHLGHALAREHEATEDYDLAYKYLSLAKKAKLESIDYDFANDEEMMHSLLDTFTRFSVSNAVNLGCNNEEPIFIVGMPRTGTTLVERILSQHSDVCTAGELEHFGLLLKEMSKSTTVRVLDPSTINDAMNIDFSLLGERYIARTRVLTGKTKKFIDKMPLNVLYVGFILMAFPKAKIICLDRQPLDTILSNYRQLFSANAYNYNYSYNLETTTKYYVLFSKLVELWKSKFPKNFYVVNYQNLVKNSEKEAKTLVNFCELEWEDSCLETNANTSPVATASAVQVRKPIHSKSIDNWKKYDAYLGSIKSILLNANKL